MIHYGIYMFLYGIHTVFYGIHVILNRLNFFFYGGHICFYGFYISFNRVCIFLKGFLYGCRLCFEACPGFIYFITQQLFSASIAFQLLNAALNQLLYLLRQFHIFQIQTAHLLHHTLILRCAFLHSSHISRFRLTVCLYYFPGIKSFCQFIHKIIHNNTLRVLFIRCICIVSILSCIIFFYNLRLFAHSLYFFVDFV